MEILSSLFLYIAPFSQMRRTHALYRTLNGAFLNALRLNTQSTKVPREGKDSCRTPFQETWPLVPCSS